MREGAGFLTSLSRPLVGVALFAVLIQIQITFGRDETSLGLTLNLADLTLPFAGLFILLSLIRRKTVWPAWPSRGTDIFMAVLTLYFTFSAWHGYSLTGALSSWALVNRLLGWGVLIAYFYAGGWLVTNFGGGLARAFTLCFAAFCLGITGAEIFGILLYDHGIGTTLLPAYPLDGFMGNRNAAAFVFLSSLIGIGLYHKTEPTRATKTLIVSFLILAPTCLFLNGSRVIMLLLPLVLLGLFVVYGRRAGGPLLLPLLIGAGLSALLAVATPHGLLREHQAARISIGAITDAGAEKLHASDSVRTLINNDALDLFYNHPVFGVGLGNFLEFQKAKYGQLIDLIDSVPLWFLTEMGAVGFSLFLVFGARLFGAVLQNARTGPETVFARMTLGIILIFCVMGLVHQIFYARFFWFMLGMACITQRHDPHPSQAP